MNMGYGTCAILYFSFFLMSSAVRKCCDGGVFADCGGCVKMVSRPLLRLSIVVSFVEGIEQRCIGKNGRGFD